MSDYNEHIVRLIDAINRVDDSVIDQGYGGQSVRFTISRDAWADLLDIAADVASVALPWKQVP